MKTTDTQKGIFNRIQGCETYTGYMNRRYYILYGAGENRSAESLVKQGVGDTTSLQPHHRTFFVFNEGYRFNYVTNEVEAYKKDVSDRVFIKADSVLGTPATWSTVKEVCDFGYMVHIDGDDPDWVGPVDFNGNILQEF